MTLGTRLALAGKICVARGNDMRAKIKEYKDGSLAEFSVPRVLACNLPHTAHAPTSGKCTSKFLY